MCLKLCRKQCGRPETTILRKACLRGRSLTGVCELGFEEDSHHSQNRQGWPTVPKLDKQHGLGWTPAFLLEFWYMLVNGCLYNQYPVKTLGTESPMSFPTRRLTHVNSQLLSSCVTPLGEDSWKLVSSFLHVPGAFFLCWFCLVPFQFPYNNSALWAWLYAECYGFSEQIIGPGVVCRTPQQD